MTDQSTNQKPKRWKMLFISFLFVYPFVNVVFFVLGDFLATLPQPVKTLILATIFVPAFGLVNPILHKRYWKWICK